MALHAVTPSVVAARHGFRLLDRRAPRSSHTILQPYEKTSMFEKSTFLFNVELNAADHIWGVRAVREAGLEMLLRRDARKGPHVSMD
jgi:hypothetical protein